MDSLIRPIPTDLQPSRRWRVEVDGAAVPRAAHVVVACERFGTLAYGLTPGGYDGWSFHEAGGGGSVILPFVRLGGEVHVGVAQQLRHNQGGVVLNAPRGFVDPRESHVEAACRELAEELGLEADAGRVVPLGGEPANPNSAFFETAGPGEGVHFFGLEVQPDEVERTGTGLGLRPGLIRSDAAARAHRAAESIGASVFIPWYEAARLSDMFTNAAVARLLAHLRPGPAGP
jgi:8-oxo-dGTP pyrophosphatase MutT (NUDIX family)